MNLKSFSVALLLLTGCRSATPQTEASAPPLAQKTAFQKTALERYLEKPEPVFDWKPIGTHGDLELTSQTWQGTVWKHRLQIFKPQNLKFPDAALLHLSADSSSGQALANATGAVVVNVHKVVNEPIFGKGQDALIAYSFQKYLETGDENWPLLFPMTKSVTQTMSAIEQWSDKKITRFVVMGASKGGWATWLAGAGDKRVVGIVPIMFDFLNMSAQLERQKAIWGAPSPQMRDYTALGLTEKIGESRGSKLVQMVDPWFYREKLMIPKLIVIGTNDPYWGHDALNIYRHDLRGPTSVLYLPNVAHSVGTAVSSVAGTLAAWEQLILAPRPVPHVNLKVEGRQWTISTDAKPSATRLWVATSPTRDFRSAKWRAIEGTQGTLPDEEKFVAAFGEIEIVAGVLPLKLSSQMWSE